MNRTDAIPAAALWAATFAVFGAGAGRLGFYYDDGAAMANLPALGWSALWGEMSGYVPGRNLHVLWQYLFFRLAGDPAAHLPTLHLLQSALDGLVVATFFLLLRRFSIPGPAALAAAGLFSFWPGHGETHFWSYAAPQNLVSTLCLALFVAAGKRRALGLAAFLGALFTYDQTVVVLLALAAYRARRAPLKHLPHLAAFLVFAWLKLRIPEGAAPVLRWEAFERLPWNIWGTVAYNAGRLRPRNLLPLLEKASAGDWALALAVTAALGAMLFWLWGRTEVRAGTLQRAPLLLAAGFCAAAYLPGWLWHLSQRHHYLPSLGICGAVALVLAWRPVLIPAAALLLLPLAAAGRGESRFWEESFALKRRLFTELRPQIESRPVLALEDFPLHHGPAYLIAPQDAQYGPRLLYGAPPAGAGGTNSPPGFAGDLSSSPAPRGVFLPAHDLARFRYFPTERFLVVRFAGLEQGRLVYDVEPRQPLPYRVLDSGAAPGGGPFAIRHAQARRQGNDLLLSLRFQTEASPDTYVALMVSFLAENGIFHRWGLLRRDRSPRAMPLLLGPAATGQWEQALLLESFPPAPRVLLEFFQTGPERSVPLGAAEVPVEP